MESAALILASTDIRRMRCNSLAREAVAHALRRGPECLSARVAEGRMDMLGAWQLQGVKARRKRVVHAGGTAGFVLR